MSKKTLVILLGLFLVLLLIAFFPALSRRIKPTADQGILNAEVNFKPFTIQSTDSFSIKKGGEEKKFSKQNNSWQVNGFEASQSEVQSFFDQLGKSKAEFLVSKNPENHKSYGLDEESGTLLSFTQNGQTSSFIIGNTASGGGFYAKKQNANNAYTVSGGFIATKLSQDVSAWRNKTVFDISKDQFQRAEIMAGKNTLTLTKNQEGKLEAEMSGTKQTLEQAVADKIFMVINPLVADGFLMDAEVQEFQKAADKTIVRISPKGGQSIELRLMKKDSNWWGKVSGRETYYRFSDSKLADFTSLEKWFEKK